jgi:UDP-N-acetylglucosamine:LPS N-acetylglucosamine transferase
MKIALVCSFGGHLTELQFLSAAFDDHETFYISYDNVRTRDLDERAYLLDSIDRSPWRMAKGFYRMGRILYRERPAAVVSTGSEIAIPAFVWARILGAETVFIESLCRVQAISATGRVVYPLSDLFLVQWPGLVDEAGDRARYEGTVL